MDKQPLRKYLVVITPDLFIDRKLEWENAYHQLLQSEAEFEANQEWAVRKCRGLIIILFFFKGKKTVDFPIFKFYFHTICEAIETTQTNKYYSPDFVLTNNNAL